MILSILKIVLIIILAIIILLLLLSFVPIEYNVNIIKKKKEFKVYLDLSYLLNLIRFKGVYNNDFLYNMKILFLKFSNKNMSKTKEKIEDKNNYPKLEMKEKRTEIVTDDENAYIFYDRDELLSDKCDTKAKELDLAEKNKSKKTKQKKEDKKNKQGLFSKIIYIIKNRKFDTIKFTVGKINEIINVIKPTETKFKFDIFGFYLKLYGKISIFRLVTIFIKLYMNKDARKLLFE